MTRRRLLLGALALLVVSLVFGSVYTTGARWVQDAPGPDANLPTGNIELSPGSPTSGDLPFGGDNIAVGEVRQAELTLTDTGSTPIEFSLSKAGPSVSTASDVTIQLAGGVGACPASTTAPLPTPAAFDTSTLSGIQAIGTPVSRTLARHASETWCVRATLTAVSGEQPAAYTIAFHFDVEQIRP